EMSVHGRYGQPCPVCGTAVQPIRYAAHETYYCPRCLTDGRLLADRAPSPRLTPAWPLRIDRIDGMFPPPIRAAKPGGRTGDDAAPAAPGEDAGRRRAGSRRPGTR